MPAQRSKISLGHYALALLRQAQDAQRHHHLTFSFRGRVTPDTLAVLRSMSRLGLIGHVRGRRLEGSDQHLLTCTLRYWEGEPLVSVVTAPLRVVSYHDLKRRAKLGGGLALLLWADGGLRTASACVEQRRGGILLATLCA
jgi:hypothetical protein